MRGFNYYAATGPTNGAHVQSITGSQVALSAMYGYGESEAANTTNGGVAVDWMTFPSGNSTPEKFNSRSSVPDSTFLADSSPSASAVGRVFVSVAGFSHSAWRAHPLRPLLVLDGEGHHVDPFPGYTGSGLKTAHFCEPIQPCQINGRRRSRRGIFFILGNDIGHHQKTGGGAFSMRAPHFDNDIAWVDKSTWNNGMSQSDVWNTNLLANYVPPTFKPAWATRGTQIIGAAF